MIQCKDCDAVSHEDPGPGSARGWSYLNITDDDADPVNGWRCPKCVAGWQIIVDEQRGNFHS
jgi:hypothetical protein